MASKVKWLRANLHGTHPIYTTEYGTDDPCDGWPLTRWSGKVWLNRYEDVTQGERVIGERCISEVFYA